MILPWPFFIPIVIAAIVIYRLTKRETMDEEAEIWVNELCEGNVQEAKNIIAGTK